MPDNPKTSPVAEGVVGLPWKPIERMTDQAVWVIKYDMWWKDHLAVEPHTEGADKFTSCHGWYASEADALKVVRHFPRPNSYQVEKVWGRELLEPAIALSKAKDTPHG